MKARVAVAALLMTSLAAAQAKVVQPEDVKVEPPIQAIPPGEDQIVPLRLHEPAPFEGQLFSPDTAIRWGFWLQQWKHRYQLDMARERNVCAVNMEFQDRELAIEKQRARTVEVDLRGRLENSELARAQLQDELNNPGFFSSPGFYYGLGIVTAGAMMGLSIWAIDAAAGN